MAPYDVLWLRPYKIFISKGVYPEKVIINEADGSPSFESITPQWTFQGKWDPEARIRKLWHFMAY